MACENTSRTGWKSDVHYPEWRLERVVSYCQKMTTTPIIYIWRRLSYTHMTPSFSNYTTIKHLFSHLCRRAFYWQFILGPSHNLTVIKMIKLFPVSARYVTLERICSIYLLISLIEFLRKIKFHLRNEPMYFTSKGSTFFPILSFQKCFFGNLWVNDGSKWIADLTRTILKDFLDRKSTKFRKFGVVIYFQRKKFHVCKWSMVDGLPVIKYSDLYWFRLSRSPKDKISPTSNYI